MSPVPSKRQKTPIDPLDKGLLGWRSPVNRTAELIREADKGALILAQVVRGSWWEWSSGSTPFFWRWNGKEQRHAAREGMEIFVSGVLPRSHAKPVRCSSPTQMRLVASNLDGMLQKRYLEEGFVRSNVN